ncbi:hypothetical protein [Dactylosporangium sp. NPDC050588]|uniref:STAS domain-containing protein n=1 Tax=Dactylosporangium sp. NPDC050588 TaxID=3157211 RepID=UPI0033E0E804
MGTVSVIEGHDAVHTIQVRGRVEADTSVSLRRALVTTMLHRQAAAVLVDLGGVTEMDPLAVGALSAAHDVARDLRLAFTVRVAQSPIAGQLATVDLPLSP